MKTASASMAELPLWKRLIMTVLLTVGIGPLIGTAIVLLPPGAVGFVPIGMLQNGIWLALLLGYVSGGLQALICGLVYALCGWQAGRLPILVPIATALPLALFFNLIFFGMSGGGVFNSIIVHIVPALATWWLVKAYWQKAEA